MVPRNDRGRKHLSAGGTGQSAAIAQDPKAQRCLLGVADGSGNGVDGKPSWGLSLMDTEYDGEWSWKIDQGASRRVMGLLASMERMTWREIFDLKTGGRRRGALHKFIPLESLCPAAQQRLFELNIDFDRLFRFRLGNMDRLWGALPMSSGIFYPIWYDADHKVCPSRNDSN